MLSYFKFKPQSQIKEGLYHFIQNKYKLKLTHLIMFLPG